MKFFNRTKNQLINKKKRLSCKKTNVLITNFAHVLFICFEWFWQAFKIGHFSLKENSNNLNNLTKGQDVKKIDATKEIKVNWNISQAF